MVLKTKETDMMGIDDELFDNTAGYDEERPVQVSSGLTENEKRQAAIIYRLFNELWGLCIVRGDPGAGKDTFLNWLLFTIKRYFPHKRILRDEKPRRLFGAYAGLFNEERIQTDLARMREVAKGTIGDPDSKRYSTSYSTALGKAADEWAGSDGAKVLLQRSVVGLTEYHRYVYNREPHNPMNKTMGGIHKMARHMDTLIIGNTQLESDLDKKTCKPFINWRVTCTRSMRDSTRYTFIVEKVKYDKRMDLLVPVGKPFPIPVDAGKPRSYIGDGRIVVKKPNYQPDSDDEELVLEALKSGIDNYDELVMFLDDKGSMTAGETLAIVKELGLKLPGKRPKFVISYPCIYKLFNSRSAPNMKSSIKIEG